MKSVTWFLAGVGAAAVLAQFATWRRTRPATQAHTGLDLNGCSREELLRVPGMNGDLAERILDNRPYRSKFDLLNRMIVPESVYAELRSRVYVDPTAAHRAVDIALAEG